MHFYDKVPLKNIFLLEMQFNIKHFYQKYISIVTFKMMNLSQASSFDCKGQNIYPSFENLLCYLLKSFTYTIHISVKWCIMENDVFIFKPYLQIGSIIFGYVWTVTLTQHCNFLLNVLYLIFSFF